METKDTTFKKGDKIYLLYGGEIHEGRILGVYERSRNTIYKLEINLLFSFLFPFSNMEIWLEEEDLKEKVYKEII